MLTYREIALDGNCEKTYISSRHQARAIFDQTREADRPLLYLVPRNENARGFDYILGYARDHELAVRRDYLINLCCPL